MVLMAALQAGPFSTLQAAGESLRTGTVADVGCAALPMAVERARVVELFTLCRKVDSQLARKMDADLVEGNWLAAAARRVERRIPHRLAKEEDQAIVAIDVRAGYRLCVVRAHHIAASHTFEALDVCLLLADFDGHRLRVYIVAELEIVPAPLQFDFSLVTRKLKVGYVVGVFGLRHHHSLQVEQLQLQDELCSGYVSAF